MLTVKMSMGKVGSGQRRRMLARSTQEQQQHSTFLSGSPFILKGIDCSRTETTSVSSLIVFLLPVLWVEALPIVSSKGLGVGGNMTAKKAWSYSFILVLVITIFSFFLCMQVFLFS
jgi:hypothetical protein